MDKEELKKLTGLRIKELRKKKGLTQEQLAEMTNIGERNLSKIECGQNFVSAETLLNLSAALDVAPFEVFKFEHYKDAAFMEQELICAIKNKQTDINFLYKVYKAI